MRQACVPNDSGVFGTALLGQNALLLRRLDQLFDTL
jgi:hypothetical protein